MGTYKRDNLNAAGVGFWFGTHRFNPSQMKDNFANPCGFVGWQVIAIRRQLAHTTVSGES
jgi:hypothetical protein